MKDTNISFVLYADNSVFSKAFVEEAVFWNTNSGILGGYQVAVHVWVCIWVLYSILLIIVLVLCIFYILITCYLQFHIWYMYYILIIIICLLLSSPSPNKSYIYIHSFSFVPLENLINTIYICIYSTFIVMIQTFWLK